LSNIKENFDPLFSFYSSDKLSGGGWSNGSTRHRISHLTRIKAREFRLQFNQFKSFFKFLGVDASKRLVRPKLSLPFQLLKDREEKYFENKPEKIDGRGKKLNLRLLRLILKFPAEHMTQNIPPFPLCQSRT